jgi:S-adenosylmethionine:tRNA ribosyltransferase-isomerase
MIAAARPVQRPSDARLLVIDASGAITHAPRRRWIDFLRAGDLVVANDAATLPASLHGVHLPSGGEIEVRLAGWAAEQRFVAVIFGAGDWRTRTEDRPLPPLLAPGDHLALGPLIAIVEALLDRRLVHLRFEGSAHQVWTGIARHGRPIQYAHLKTPLALWDVWTPIAARPVAFEAPSASFALDWQSLGAMRRRGVGFGTITLAAGISSTGDGALDRRLPFDEPYRIPAATACAIERVKAQGGRIVAVGTTVVRALEHSRARAGDGVADQRIGPTSRLRVVDAILSGTHEPGGTHYQVLRAFADDDTLGRASAQLEALGFRTHEFGDSILLEKSESGPAARVAPRRVVEELLGERIETRTGAFAPDALQADARALDEEKKLVRQALGLVEARLAAKPDQALALAALVLLDQLSCRVLAPGELDRRVDEGAAAPARFVGELRDALEEGADLRLGVAGIARAHRIPGVVGLGGELAEVRRDELVLRREVPVQGHLVGAGGPSDRLDAHRMDAVTVEKLARRGENTAARRGLCLFRRLHARPVHAALTGMLLVSTIIVTTR